MNRIALAVAAAAVAAATVPAQAGGGCHDETATQAATREIHLTLACFGPTVAWVAPGATITWINDDHMSHVVTGTGRAIASQDLEYGDRYRFTFASPGIYPYACSYHPGMVGAVVVGAPPAPAGASRIAAPATQAPDESELSTTPAASTGTPERGGTLAGVAAMSGGVLGALGFVAGRRRRSLA